MLFSCEIRKWALFQDKIIGAVSNGGGGGGDVGGGLSNGKTAAAAEDKAATAKDGESGGSPSRKAPPPPKPSLATKETVSSELRSVGHMYWLRKTGS